MIKHSNDHLQPLQIDSRDFASDLLPISTLFASINGLAYTGEC